MTSTMTLDMMWSMKVGGIKILRYNPRRASPMRTRIEMFHRQTSIFNFSGGKLENPA